LKNIEAVLIHFTKEGRTYWRREGMFILKIIIKQGSSPYPRKRPFENETNHPHQMEQPFLLRKGSLICKKVIQEEALIYLFQPSSKKLR